MTANHLNILADVVRVAPSLHRAGTFSAVTLEAIARHAASRPVQHSVETGSGASTLLLSHLSQDHTVFALDGGTDSIQAVQASPLLLRHAVTFVEGPTQLTLPRHVFAHPLQFALIDGPHGFPFPDLEYYYLYPQLEAGALLVVDDIQIPTIHHLFEFLSADAMFELQEVVGTTAFFRRTAAPTFSPLGDGWWEQGYNARVTESTEATLMRFVPPKRVGHSTLFFVDNLGPIDRPLEAATLRVRTTEPLVVSGWAVDSRRCEPAAAVDLVLDGATYRARVGLSRGDVATAHGNQAYLECGFSARFPKGAIVPGFHELEIRIVIGNGLEYVPGGRLRFEAV